MAETPRRDLLSEHWRSVLDDLEARVDELCRDLERSRQRCKTQREGRRLEQARNIVLRDQVRRLRNQVLSLGGKPRD